MLTLYMTRGMRRRKKILVYFLLLSKTNIDVTMELFVTKMKTNIYDIIQRPKLLDLIMEKRITPHVQVPQILFYVQL